MSCSQWMQRIRYKYVQRNVYSDNGNIIIVQVSNTGVFEVS